MAFTDDYAMHDAAVDDLFSLAPAKRITWQVDDSPVSATLGIKVAKVKDVEKEFFHLFKTSTPVQAVLCAKMPDLDAVARRRALPRTKIVEDIVALRDAAFAESVASLQEHGSCENGRNRKNKGKGDALKVPAYTNIDVAGDDAAPGIKLAVLNTRPGTALFVELTSAVLDMLATTIKCQFECGDIHRKRPRDVRPETSTVDVGVKGAFYSHSYDRIVLKAPPAQSGGFVTPSPKKFKTFPCKQIGLCEAIARAKQAAETNAFVDDASS